MLQLTHMLKLVLIFLRKQTNGKAYQTSIPNLKIHPKSKPFLNMKNHNHALKIKSSDKTEDPSRQWNRAYQILGERVGYTLGCVL